MAVFQHIQPEDMARHFRYRGWFCGIVPVYVGDLQSVNGPAVSVRNGIPEWTLDLVHVLWDGLLGLVLMVNPAHQDSGWPIKITGRLDGKPLMPGEAE